MANENFSFPGNGALLVSWDFTKGRDNDLNSGRPERHERAGRFEDRQRFIRPGGYGYLQKAGDES